ncbi:MAG: Ser-Thr-rich GPI-anchored membrane family protein [Candidatus Thorarchaeota archaeon]
MKSIKKKANIKFLIILLIFSAILNSESQPIEITPIPKQSGTGTLPPPPNGAIGYGFEAGANQYIPWAYNITSGLSELAVYALNASEYSEFMLLPREHRNPGNFSYTSLLASWVMQSAGIFYPPYYQNFWWIIYINHGSGTIVFDEITQMFDDSVQITSPTNSDFWSVDEVHNINWNWGGDFAEVNIDLYHDGNFMQSIVNNAENNGSYQWEIPDNILIFDDLYQINVSNSDYGITSALSDAYFEISPKKVIKINSPTNSTWWMAGTSHAITWTSGGFIPLVNISLYKGATLEYFFQTINNGTYLWDIPIDVKTGDDWKIKIEDSTDSTIFDEIAYFSINGTISITSPTDSTSWIAGISYAITWTSGGFIPLVNISLYKGATLEYFFQTINNGTYLWDIPIDVKTGDDWKIKIEDYYNPYVFDIISNFTISEIKSLTITNPLSGAKWEKGKSHYINWTSTGDINFVNIQIYKGNNNVYQILHIENTGSYLWNIPSNFTPGNDYIIIIQDYDSTDINATVIFEIIADEKAPTDIVSGYDLVLLMLSSFCVIIFVSIIFKKKIIQIK